MIHPHQLLSLGKLYHEEALKVARVRRIGHWAKAPRRPRWLGKQAAATVRLS